MSGSVRKSGKKLVRMRGKLADCADIGAGSREVSAGVWKLSESFQTRLEAGKKRAGQAAKICIFFPTCAKISASFGKRARGLREKTRSLGVAAKHFGPVLQKNLRIFIQKREGCGRREIFSEKFPTGVRECPKFGKKVPERRQEALNQREKT